MLIGSYKGGFLREEDDSPVNSNRFLSSMHAMSSEEEADERVKDVLE